MHKEENGRGRSISVVIMMKMMKGYVSFYVHKEAAASHRKDRLVSVFFFFLFLYSTFYGEESAFLFLLWLDFQCSSVLVAIVLKPVNRGITLGLWIKKKNLVFLKKKRLTGWWLSFELVWLEFIELQGSTKRVFIFFYFFSTWTGLDLS